jgi:hypothetical protein
VSVILNEVGFVEAGVVGWEVGWEVGWDAG